MLSRNVATRLLTATALSAATVGSLVGIAGPAAAASTVTVNLTIDVSGSLSSAGSPQPINAVDLRTYNSAGVQVARDCLLQPDPRSGATERRTITPAGGYDVSVPAGGKLEGRPAASSCWLQDSTAAPTVFRAGSTDAAVTWYLHP